MGVLKGTRVVEVAGLGPGPFCGMLLADLGAEVIVIERPGAAIERTDEIYNRGKRSIVLDLKEPRAKDIALRLIERADLLIEGMRPGTMERLLLGPDICLGCNPRLVYGRMTGWGQRGPLAHAAGHDSNYAALAGALWFASRPGEPPMLPTTVVGDIAGGALYLAIGLLAAMLHARATGEGQVVDAAIVDGTAHAINLLLAIVASSGGRFERGAMPLDAAFWAGRSYRCADGRWINISPLEPQFYGILLERLGLDRDEEFVQGQFDPARWSALALRMEALIAMHDSDHWCGILEGTDACFAPVLSPVEAARHPHLVERETYACIDGVLQAAPAPRFSRTPSAAIGSVPRRGADGRAILRDLGLSDSQIHSLKDEGCCGL